MSKSFTELSVFSFIVVSVTFAFTVSFYVAYGSLDPRFTSVGDTFLILFFYLTGGFAIDREMLFGADTHHVSKPLLFLAYILLTYLIAINIFMAIVLDAYTFVVVVRKSRTTLKRKANAPE